MGPKFLINEMGIIVPTAQYCYKEYNRHVKLLNSCVISSLKIILDIVNILFLYLDSIVNILRFYTYKYIASGQKSVLP